MKEISPKSHVERLLGHVQPANVALAGIKEGTGFPKLNQAETESTFHPPLPSIHSRLGPLISAHGQLVKGGIPGVEIQSALQGLVVMNHVDVQVLPNLGIQPQSRLLQRSQSNTGSSDRARPQNAVWAKGKKREVVRHCLANCIGQPGQELLGGLSVFSPFERCSGSFQLFGWFHGDLPAQKLFERRQCLSCLFLRWTVR